MLLATSRRLAPTVAPRMVVFAAPPPCRTQAFSVMARVSKASMAQGMRLNENAGSLIVAFTRPAVLASARRAFSTAKAQSESLLQMYGRWLEEHPILTKSITSMIIGGAGDAACQLWIDDAEWSWRRLFNMSFLGLVLVGPALHVFYSRLWAWMPGTSTAMVLRRLAVDQLIWAPCFISVFFVAMNTMQGKTPDAYMKDLPANVMSASIVNWKLWPIANFINFKYLPVKYQVLFANCVALIWNAYLSLATNKRDPVPAQGEVPPV